MERVLITGANRGVGLALAEQFVNKGHPVIAVCRNNSEALQALGAEVITGCDVTQPQALESLKEQLAGQSIDVLVNNAGLLHRNTLDSLETDSLMQQYEVNAVAPLMLTQALLDNLKVGSKVAIITSRMGSLEDNESGGQYGYRMSKAAANMAGKSLSVDLKPRGIAVGLLHPGYVKTDMTGGQGYVTATDSAKDLYQRIAHLDISNSGSFWHAEGQELPW